MPRLAAVALSLAVLAAALAEPRRAESCGMFSAGTGALPSIAVERVVLVHDEQAGVEHLLREIAFDKVDRPFGFVVPTPSKPEVSRVDDLRWSILERTFPLAAPGKGGGAGFGSGEGRLGGAGVKVYEAKRIGSFAAYVLQATDARALKGWLDRNQFVTTEASQAWLEHYVKLQFFFVALRFDPGLFREKAPRFGRGTRAETMRITFATPVPFFPYREPDRADPTDERALALWLVTRGKPRVPVALVQDGDRLSYQRPWREGFRRPTATADTLARTLGESTWKALAPSGEAAWQVQVFEDQKRSRHGFGDVLLVPEDPADQDSAAREKLRALLPLLDPALEGP